MIHDIIKNIWDNFRWRSVGVAIGLVIGVLFLNLGFFKTIFILICIGLGFFIGNKLDHHEDLMDYLDRLLPPGYKK